MNTDIAGFHDEQTRRYGLVTAESLGWNSRENQELRFEELLLIGDLAGCSVLDVGCGYGDLRYLIHHRWPNVDYLGIDHSADFLQEAACRSRGMANTRFIHGDFSTLPLPVVDYVFASGSLSYRSGEPNQIYRAIDRLFSCCRRGFAFNLLTEAGDENSVLVAYEPATMVAHCRRLSGEVELREQYLDGDFTVLMRR